MAWLVRAKRPLMCLQYRLELGSFLAVTSGNLLHRILKSRLLKVSLAWEEESGRSSKWTWMRGWAWQEMRGRMEGWVECQGGKRMEK